MIKRFFKEFFTDTFILDEYGISQVSSIAQFILFYFLNYAISACPLVFIDLITCSSSHATHCVNTRSAEFLFILITFVMMCSYIVSKRYGVRGTQLCFFTLFWIWTLLRSPILISKAECERKLKIIKEVMDS